MKDFIKNLLSGKTRKIGSKVNKPILSCVVDTHPKFLMQSWIWLVSAHLSGAFEDCDVVVHHVGEPPQVLKDATARFGARLVVIEPFGDGAARYCNCLLYTSPSPRDGLLSRMPSSA